MAKIAEALRVHLEANPQINFVYFNSKGEWVYIPNKNYLDRQTRSKVLGMDVETEPELTPTEIEIAKESENPVKKTKK